MTHLDITAFGSSIVEEAFTKLSDGTSICNFSCEFREESSFFEGVEKEV